MVGSTAQVPLAQGHEAGVLDDGAGAKMMRLEPEELQEHMEEGARRQPEPALEVREEDHALLPLGTRTLLAARQTDANVRLPRKAPRGPKVGDIVGVIVEPIHKPDGSDITGRREGRRTTEKVSAQGRGCNCASVARSRARAGGQEGASENNVRRPLAPLNL